MTVEFHCEGCGKRVVALPLAEPPAHGLCIVCAYLCTTVPDPEEMVAVRRAIRQQEKV